MTIAIVISENWEPAKLVRWSARIARARREDLLIIRPRRLEGPHTRRKTKGILVADRSPLTAALAEQVPDLTVVDLDREVDAKAAVKRRSGDLSSPRVYLRQLAYAQLLTGILDHIRLLRVKLLIVPRQRGRRWCEEEMAIERRLFREAPCETLLLRPGRNASDHFESILVATSGSKNALPALNFGAAVASDQQSKLTTLYVEEGRGEASPVPLPKNVDRSIRKSLKKKPATVARQAVVDRDVPRGVRSFAAAQVPDVVVVGAGGRGAEARRAPASVHEQLMSEMEEPTVVVVRNAMPLADRLLRMLENRKKNIVPQLDRGGRIDLVTRLQSSVHFDFDFMFLICLATVLASLGLVVDSPPVVIGAMLVAPLLTPMLGLGLSVVQGNRLLGRKCIGTIARGFLTALLTACGVASLRLLFTTDVTQEMSNRGAPGVLDLGVAFVSGVVAAYAFGRPHLLSVIPGIAIATSLVPPVATVGLALISWKWGVALGALVLFLSNFVAIVLGSAASLWVVGMRGPREICPVASWERRWVLGFLAASACLALFLAVRSDDSQLHAFPVAAAEDAGHHLARPAEPHAARQTNPHSSPTPLAEDGGEFRMVRKPLMHRQDQSAEPQMSNVVPNPSVRGDRADVLGEDGQQHPGARRRRPLLRVLREARDLFRPRQRDDRR
ncbi:MAG: DUF389 domain-containing protein [Planctomycetales bacterium]|nr:DUF389 domain-containing protein [Planctomycetales bacterium]NIM08824.1 DUF389 domain-containing protein [Planctomycetales bacterium]NIN08285.1 DUF389 domain-containing protein [Planctomycetales bacterium]NIN77414.1 DUF389 domain-containing protein [Planctomycetales bacterium]NIO34588.1 DUF389 domain-containing protein [Planctomycetales bacterium]